jgi:hypothetical protein
MSQERCRSEPAPVLRGIFGDTYERVEEELQQRMQPVVPEVMKNDIVRFRPINSDEYKSPPKRMQPADEGSKNSHVAGCRCAACRRQSRRPQKPQPLCDHAGIRLVTTLLEPNGFRFRRNRKRQNVVWSTQHLKPSEFQAMQHHQRVNQFPRTYECTRKDSLSR